MILIPFLLSLLITGSLPRRSAYVPIFSSEILDLILDIIAKLRNYDSDLPLSAKDEFIKQPVNFLNKTLKQAQIFVRLLHLYLFITVLIMVVWP